MIANGQMNIQDEVIARAHYAISQLLGMPAVQFRRCLSIIDSSAASSFTAAELVSKRHRNME